MIKFIHGADIHLDSPFKGMQSAPAGLWKLIKNSTFLAFVKLIDLAIEQHVDFVLLAGDLYDQDEQSLMAQSFLVEQFNRLKEADTPVYISFGNHDYLDAQKRHFDFPDNIHTFGPTVETKTIEVNNQLVEITGFSYQARWVNEPMIQNYPEKNSHSDYAIGMLHGSLAGSSTPHQSYAPFTISELKAKNYDYWALGHIHKREVLSENPPIIYAGNTQGRHKNEAGPKGCYLVTLDGKQATCDFLETDAIEWLDLPIQLPEVTRVEDVINEIHAQMDKLDAKRNYLITIRLTSQSVLDHAVIEQIVSGELLALLQSQTTDTAPYHWINQIKYTPQTNEIYTEIDEIFWQQSEKTVFAATEIEKMAGKLTAYPFLAEALKDQDFIQELKETTLLKIGQKTENDHAN